MDHFNESISPASFPEIRKNAEIKSAFKKKSRIDSILPVISKIFVELILKLLITFFEPSFCKYRHNAQNCLFVTIEKLKKCLDTNGVCGALLKGFLKECDCLPHSLLIENFHAYGFDKTSTDYITGYLSYRPQKIKINRNFSRKNSGVLQKVNTVARILSLMRF